LNLPELSAAKTVHESKTPHHVHASAVCQKINQQSIHGDINGKHRKNISTKTRKSLQVDMQDTVKQPEH